MQVGPLGQAFLAQPGLLAEGADVGADFLPGNEPSRSGRHGAGVSLAAKHEAAEKARKE
jgi:hypothetical protein